MKIPKVRIPRWLRPTKKTLPWVVSGILIGILAFGLIVTTVSSGRKDDKIEALSSRLDARDMELKSSKEEAKVATATANESTYTLGLCKRSVSEAWVAWDRRNQLAIDLIADRSFSIGDRITEDNGIVAKEFMYARTNCNSSLNAETIFKTSK